MPVRTDKYTPAKIERIRQVLVSHTEAGNPKDYEIFVDGLKIVDRTDDVEQFDLYADFIDGDTESIAISIYNGASPRNDKHIFYLKEKTAEQGLNGVNVDQRIEEKITAEKRNWEFERLEEKNSGLEKTIEEKDEYIGELETAIDDLQTKKFHLGNLNLGELSSVVLEGFIRRNPQMLAKLPGGEALAGIIEADNEEQANGQPPQQPAEDAEVSIEEDTPGEATLSEEEKGLLVFIKQLQDKFDQPQLIKVMEILDLLAEDHTLIEPTFQFLTQQNP